MLIDMSQTGTLKHVKQETHMRMRRKIADEGGRHFTPLSRVGFWRESHCRVRIALVMLRFKSCHPETLFPASSATSSLIITSAAGHITCPGVAD